MTNAELIAKIKAEIERRITDNTFGAKLELIDILAWLDTLESEKPMNPEEAMKELDEKIALVKRRGTWDMVDVDKYMDEVRGREPEKPKDLEEAAEKSSTQYYQDAGYSPFPNVETAAHKSGFIAGAKWDREQMMKDAVEYEVGMHGEPITVNLDKYVQRARGIFPGDKVRVIVIPNTDEK